MIHYYTSQPEGYYAAGPNAAHTHVLVQVGDRWADARAVLTIMEAERLIELLEQAIQQVKAAPVISP